MCKLTHKGHELISSIRIYEETIRDTITKQAAKKNNCFNEMNKTREELNQELNLIDIDKPLKFNEEKIDKDHYRLSLRLTFMR